MSNCPETGLTVPECSCGRCIERQLEEFAPRPLVIRRVAADGAGPGPDGGTLPQGAIPPGP